MPSHGWCSWQRTYGTRYAFEKCRQCPRGPSHRQPWRVAAPNSVAARCFVPIGNPGKDRHVATKLQTQQMFYNISTAQGGGGSFQPWGTYRKRVRRFQLVRNSNDLRLKWFVCQLIWESNDWLSTDLRVKWFEIQMIWLSTDLRFNWFGDQLVWVSNDLVISWFEFRMIWWSAGLRIKRFVCHVIGDSNGLVVNWFQGQMIGCQLIWESNDWLATESRVKRFAVQMFWLTTDLRFKWLGDQLMRFKWFGWSADLRLQWFFLQKPSFEAFLRDVLQRWSFEAQKRSSSARLPSKVKFESSKNEVFLRDFLQKSSLETQNRSCSARLPSKITFES